MTTRSNLLRGKVIERTSGNFVGFFYYIDFKGRDASKAYYILLAESNKDVEIFPFIDFKFTLLHTSHEARHLSKVGDNK